jgi:hypothetical protein
MPATLLLFEMKEDFHLTRGQRQIGGHEMVYSSWITEANSENIKNLALHSVKDQASMTSVPSVVLMHQSPTPHMRYPHIVILGSLLLPQPAAHLRSALFFLRPSQQIPILLIC